MTVVSARTHESEIGLFLWQPHFTADSPPQHLFFTHIVTADLPHPVSSDLFLKLNTRVCLLNLSPHALTT